MNLDLKHKAYRIEPDGTYIEVVPDNGKRFKLDELYRHTNCDCVQLCCAVFDETGKPLARGRVPSMWMDENGKYKPDARHNALATTLLFGNPNGRYGDFVVGTVLICPAKMSK